MHKDCENYPQTGQSSSDSFTQTLKLSTTVMIIIDFSGPASYPPLPVTGVWSPITSFLLKSTAPFDKPCELTFPFPSDSISLVCPKVFSLSAQAPVSFMIHEDPSIQMVLYKCLIITICHSRRNIERRLHVYDMDGEQISVFLHPLLFHIKQKVITI